MAGILGIAIGFIAGTALEWASSFNMIDENSFTAFSVALTGLSLGIGRLLSLDGLFCVFTCGIVFSFLAEGQTQEVTSKTQESIDLVSFVVLEIYTFLFIYFCVAKAFVF